MGACKEGNPGVGGLGVFIKMFLRWEVWAPKQKHAWNLHDCDYESVAVLWGDPNFKNVEIELLFIVDLTQLFYSVIPLYKIGLVKIRQNSIRRWSRTCAYKDYSC